MLSILMSSGLGLPFPVSTSDFKRPMYVPRQEYVGGLHDATAGVKNDKKPRTFAKKADFMRAYWAGELDPDDPVEIMGEE